MKYRVTVAATMLASLGGVSFADETVLWSKVIEARDIHLDAE